MKVLLLHNRYQLSGGEDAVYEREHGLLLQYGHQVMEYTRDNREIANYGSISKATLAVRTTWAWDSHREIAKLLAEVKPDVAHFHNTLPLISPAAYYACKAANVPVVQTLHNYRLLCPAANFVRDHAPFHAPGGESVLEQLEREQGRDNFLRLSFRLQFGARRSQ